MVYRGDRVSGQHAGLARARRTARRRIAFRVSSPASARRTRATKSVFRAFENNMFGAYPWGVVLQRVLENTFGWSW